MAGLLRSLCRPSPLAALSSRLGESTLPATSALHRLLHQPPSDPDQEIYNGILATQIKLVKAFSLTTSCIGLACQPVLLMKTSTANPALVLGAAATMAFFTFATPLLIHTISKKYVTKLYYNQVEDKYTAVVYSLLLRPKKVEFKLGDVAVPEIPGMFTTFKARDTPLFVEGSSFHDPQHYSKLMGYDKPLDLMWDSELDCTKSEAAARRRREERVE